MNCPECGFKNRKYAGFCEECGYDMRFHPENQYETSGLKINNLILTVIILVVGIILFFVILNWFFSSFSL